MTTLEIKEMRLRLGGYSPQQAEQIGRQVTQALAERVENLPAGRPLGRLEIKVRASEGQTAGQLTEAIVQAILQASLEKFGG